MSALFQRRKKRSSFTGTAFVIIVLAGASFLLWQIIYSPAGVQKQVVLEIPEGSAAVVRIDGGSSFVEIPDVGALIEGESVRATQGSSTALTFFDGSRITLDSGTEVTLTHVREHDADASVDIEVTVKSGRIWASVPSKVNPKSKVSLTNSSATVETSGGEISLSESTVRVIKGKAQVLVQGEPYTTLEIGQEITILPNDVETIVAGGVGPEKALVSAEFQSSAWFTAHMNKQEIPLIEPDLLGGEIVEPEEAVAQESAVQIIEPAGNNARVTIAADTTTISGTVPEETAKVLVNDYALTRFIPGDTEFTYNAALAWGTLEEGANEYVVVALGENGEREEATITIVYDPNGEEDETASVEGEETEADSEAETGVSPTPSVSPNVSPTPLASASPSASPSGELTIDEPSDGDTVDDALINVTGKAPSNAAKIIVDDYTLTAFTTGDETWTYRMSDDFDNRPLGEKVIEVEAYDASNTLIASTEIVITIEEAEEELESKDENESGEDEETAEAEFTPTATPSGNATPTPNWPEERGDFLPPVPADDQGGPTI